MEKTVDYEKIEQSQLTDKDLNYLKSSGPRALPNNPTANNWSPEAIKKHLYKQSEIIFQWLRKACEADLEFAKKVDKFLTDLKNGAEIAEKASKDANGNVIHTTYETKADAASKDALNAHLAGAETFTGKKTFTGGAEFSTANVKIGSSGSDNSKSFDIYYTTNLRGPVVSNTIIPGNTFALGSAEHYWGEAFIDDLYLYGSISDGLYEWTLPAKNGTFAMTSDVSALGTELETALAAEVAKFKDGTYTSKKAQQDEDGNTIKSTYIKIASLVNNLTSTSTTDPLTAYQGKLLKDSIDAINAVLSSNDADLDTIQELVTYVKNNKSLIDNITTLKVSVADIIDNLTSQVTNKPLSANQGYVLKGLIDSLSAAKIAFTDIVNNLTTNESAKPLSAAQGYVLKGLIDDLERWYLALSGIAEDYDSTSTYSKGDVVANSGNLFRAKADITTAEEWTSAHWESVTVVELINEKLSKGDYDGTTGVGYATLAGNLDSKVAQNDNAPYIFRTSGGSLEIGDTCKEKAIIGGTIFWNQLIPDYATSWSGSGLTVSREVNTHKYTISGTANASSGRNLYDPNLVYGIPAGHKVLILFTNYINSGANNVRMFLEDSTYSHFIDLGSSNPTKIITTTEKLKLLLGWGSGNSFDYSFTLHVFDLTTMFGSTIADFIYTLEQGTAGAGVAFFRKYFGKPYYPYCAPTPANVKVSGKKRVGFNQWDEQWEKGDIVDGADSPNNSHYRSVGYTRVTPNTTYYFRSPGSRIYIFYFDASKNYINGDTWSGSKAFTTPADAHYIRFCDVNSATYGGGININFHYDGERDGEYEQYREETYPIDPVELKGIFKLDANNNLYADGDRYNYDGSVEGNYDEVDLGELTWQLQYDYFLVSYVTGKKYGIKNFIPQGGVIASSYTGGWDSNFPSGTWGGSKNSTQIVYKMNAGEYASAAAFKTAMAGKKLIYELAEPTEETTTPFSQIQSVDNWGTEKYLAPESDTRPVEVPVGHDTDYPLDCKSKVEIAPDLPHSDGTYVLKVESGTGTYTALATYLSDNGYEKVVDVSDSITDVAGLTYAIKKAYKVGNLVSLTIKATNSTGSTISSFANLANLAQELRPSANLPVASFIGETPARFIVHSDGYLSCPGEIANGSMIYIVVTYAVA